MKTGTRGASSQRAIPNIPRLKGPSCPLCVVPSGKFSTLTPARYFRTTARSAIAPLIGSSRRTKIVPICSAARPTTGQRATSIFARAVIEERSPTISGSR